MLSGTDRCLLLLGNPGRFQWLTVFLLAILRLHAALNHLTLAAYAVVPTHRCLARPNATVGDSDLWPVETREGRRLYSSCLLYKDPENHHAGTQVCDNGWEYRAIERESNIVSEWDLVCDRSYLRHLLFYVAPACSMLGAFCFSVFSDRVCRKIALILAHSLQTLSSIALLFAPTYIVFITVFAFQIVFSSGTLVASYVLMLETLPTPFHLQGACALSFSWFIAPIVLAFLLSLIVAWRYLQLAISAPAIVCMAFLWLLPKSLLQLFLLKKKPAAEETLSRMAHFSRILLPSTYKSLLRHAARPFDMSNVAVSDRHSLGELFLHTQIRRYLLTQLYLWTVVSLFLHIEVSEIGTLADKKSAHYFVRGFMCVGVLMLVYVLAKRFGTVRVQTLLLAVGGTSYVVAAIFDHRRYRDRSGASVSAVVSGLGALVGWTMATVAREVMVFDVVKSMPTGVRALGLACCIAAGNTAEMVAPSLSTLGGLLPFFFAMAGCGVLVLTAAGLSLVYPDFWHRPLPPTFEMADDSKTAKNNKRTGSYSLPYDRYAADFVYATDENPTSIDTALTLTHQTSRTESETFCKRPLETSVASKLPGQQGSFSTQMVYPEQGSVYFQSVRKGGLYQSNSSCKQPPSPCSAAYCDSDTESRLSDIEEEMKCVLNLSLEKPGPSSQQHDLRCFPTPQLSTACGYCETAF